MSAPHCLVTIGGVVQARVLEWSTDARVNAVSTATLSLPVPLGAEVVVGAEVAIGAGLDDAADGTVFWGQVTGLPTSFSADGATAEVDCSGWEWQLDLRLKSDLRFAGGAPTAPTLLATSVYHVGAATIAWYADPSPDGPTVSRFVDPGVDARFVHLTGSVHGSNSYAAEPAKDIASFSRIEIWQDGSRRGYVNLPIGDERTADKLDYTDDANWDAFDVTIGCDVSGDAAFEIRFTSGTNPDTGERDDYEVKGVFYDTAARMSVRQVVASILRARGYGAAGNGVPYRLRTVRDLDGNAIALGGNGLIDNGHVTLSTGDRPWSWMAQTAQLFGHAVCGNPDGIDLGPLVGDPADRAPVLSLAEGVNVLEVKPSESIASVVTDWTVLGASGSDANGDPFQYASQSSETAAPAWLVTAADALADQKSSDLLVSDGLCRAVREILEVQTGQAPLDATLSILPTNALRLGDVVAVTSPTLGLARNLWVTGVRQVWGANGWTTELDCHADNGGATAEADAAVAPATAPDVGGYHIGSHTVAWYATPGPDGASVALGFAPGGAYRAVRVTGRVHGSNSVPSGSTPSTWSTVEVWQFGVRIGSAKLPHATEHAERRYDYASDSHWSGFDLTIAADIADAAAEIRYVAGTMHDGTVDDFEIKNTAIALYSEANEQPARAVDSIDWQAFQSRRRWRWAGRVSA